MRAYALLMVALGGLLLLYLATGAAAQTHSDASNDTTKVQLAFLHHAEKVEQTNLSDMLISFSTTNLKVAPSNLTFALHWTRVVYQDSGTEVVKELNKTSLAGSHRDEGRGAEGDASEGGDDSERQAVEAKFKLDWHSLSFELSHNNNTTLWQFRLKDLPQVQPGYYLLRLQVMDRTRDNTTLLWLYSKEPLKVFVAALTEPVKLHIMTTPDFEKQVLDFVIDYQGPFLENPVVYVTAPQLALKDLRVNVTGLMQAGQGQLNGSLSFAPYAIPQGTFLLTLRGHDAAERTIVVHSQFTLKALDLTRETFNQLSTEGGRLELSLMVKENLSNARLSLEELDVNPRVAPNQTRLLARYVQQLAPGEIRGMGRYLSVEPSSRIREQLDNATLRFWVNETDTDEQGAILAGRVHGLRVFYYNQTNQQWELVERSGYDERGFVWAVIPHFSIYGLFGTNVAPSATADPTIISTTVDESVTLTGSGADLDGQIVEWAWDFEGDGTYDQVSSTTGTATHIYATAGTYNAKLRVTDEQGATGFAYTTVTVKETETGGSSDLPLPLPMYVTLVALVLALAVVHQQTKHMR